MADVQKRSNGDEDYVIIREVYEQENAEEQIESELELALEKNSNVIIIEPSKLGDETARWITVGNCLHKTSVISSLACLIGGSICPDKQYVYFPLGAVSFTCAGIYAISWQFDPCCKYQIEYDVRKLEKLPLHQLSCSSPVVLVRKDDSRRKTLHNIFSLLASSFCAWKFYQWYYR